MIAALVSRLGKHGLMSRMLGDSLISFGSKILGAALTFVMIVVFSRLMTADQFGFFGVAMNAAILLSTLIGLGLPVAVMRIYPAHVARAETALATGFISSGYTTILAASLVLMAGAAVTSVSGVADGMTGSAIAPMLIATLAMLVALSDYAASALRSQGHVAWSALPRDIGWRITAPMVAALLVVAGMSLPNTLALGACIVTLAVVTAVQFRRSRSSFISLAQGAAPETDWARWRRPLLPLWIASLVFALIQQADVLVVGGILGPQEAGAYFAAQKTAALLGLAMIAGGQVAAPMMASAYHSGNLPELRRICRLLAAAIAVVTFAGLVFIAGFGDRLLAIFKPEFVSAYPVLVVFAVSATVDALCGPTAYLMQMTTLERAYLKIMAASYAVVLVLQLIFVPRYGLLAAAACNAAGVVVWNIFAITLIRRRIGVDPSVFSFILPLPTKS
jgi:O-antigen/teichoic acid export membrane protein